MCSQYWHLKASMRCPVCDKETIWDFTTHFMGDVGSFSHEYRLGEAVDELNGVTVLLDGRIESFLSECPTCEALFDAGADIAEGKVRRVFLLRRVEVRATIIKNLKT